MPAISPRSNRWRQLVALLLGAASVLAYAPVGWFPLIWLTLAGLFGLLSAAADAGESSGARLRQGSLLGAAFGFGLFIAGVSWVYVSLSVFGGMPAAVAALATVLFCLVLALFPAMVGALFVRYSPSGSFGRALFFAALWTLAEWLRGWVFTGFPWLAVGYSQVLPSPLGGYAPIVGVYGVSLLSALVASLLFAVLRRWFSAESCRTVPWLRWCPAVPLLAVALICVIGDALRDVRWSEPQGEPLSVALLQGNIPQDLKWRPEFFTESLRTYYRLALDNPAQLTVLPETALPAFLGQVPREYLDELEKLARRKQGDLLFGIALGEADGGANSARYANGAVSLGTSPGQHYRKSHLVPFGEFVPPGFAWFLTLAHIPMSDFTPGARVQPPMALAGQKVAVNICYEDAFGEDIIATVPDATLLVNLSNVAWFGDSLAPAQHLQIAQMRALETGRMMLRATNTGMTAIVGVDGRVQGVLPPFTQGALLGEVRGYSGVTPYVRWGNWPLIGFACLLLAVFWLRRPTNGLGCPPAPAL
jgi:apolipoprotein N-acyltransferase